jgi:hypothetical protein
VNGRLSMLLMGMVILGLLATILVLPGGPLAFDVIVAIVLLVMLGRQS